MCLTTASLLTLLSVCSVGAGGDKPVEGPRALHQPLPSGVTHPSEVAVAAIAAASTRSDLSSAAALERSVQGAAFARAASPKRVFVASGDDSRSDRTRIAESSSSYSMAAASAFRVGLSTDAGISLFLAGRALGGNSRAPHQGVPDIDATGSLPHGAMLGAGISF